MIKRTVAFLRKYRLGIICILAVALCYFGLGALGVTCPIKHLTGVSCAGCGMTRACLSALTLDFSAAFYYHPLWVVMPLAIPLIAALLIKRKMRALCVVIAVLAVLFVGVYIYRLLTPDGDIIVFAPSEGAIYRMLTRA